MLLAPLHVALPVPTFKGVGLMEFKVSKALVAVDSPSIAVSPKTGSYTAEFSSPG